MFVHIENMKHWEIINTYEEVSQGREEDLKTESQQDNFPFPTKTDKKRKRQMIVCR